MAAEPVSGADIPVLLGVASPERPHRVRGLEEQLLGEIEHRLGYRLHPASQVIPRDHVAAIVALREAENLIETKQATYLHRSGGR